MPAEIRISLQYLLVIISFAMITSGCGSLPVCDAPEGLEEADFSAPKGLQDMSTRELMGNPPRSGLRYWHRQIHKMPVYSCYVSVIDRSTAENPLWELWHNTWGDDASQRALSVIRAPNIAGLDEEKEISVCTGELIDDVFTPGRKKKGEEEKAPELSPTRGYTRPHIIRDEKWGYVALVCVTPDYKSYLVPAILTSPTGKKGTWKYHGMLKGEPQEYHEKRGKVWSDGGAIIRMPDGSWRIYLNNYGKAAISLLTSEALDGPWKFWRDEEGNIRDLVPPGPDGKKRPNCFPFVQRVSDSEWHMWYSDRWVPHSIWHLQSPDGLEWEFYGQQPEITRSLTGGRAVKCMRTTLSPDGSTILGFLSVWKLRKKPDNYSWRLYLMRMPVGLK